MCVKVNVFDIWLWKFQQVKIQIVAFTWNFIFPFKLLSLISVEWKIGYKMERAGHVPAAVQNSPDNAVTLGGAQSETTCPFSYKSNLVS